jgi:hypothetical protein
MKLFLTAFCASLMIAPLSFAEKCEKGKCDKKDEATLLAEKCEKGKCDKKDEATLLAEKCEKGKCDKKDEATLA